MEYVAKHGEQVENQMENTLGTPFSTLLGTSERTTKPLNLKFLQVLTSPKPQTREKSGPNVLILAHLIGGASTVLLCFVFPISSHIDRSITNISGTLRTPQQTSLDMLLFGPLYK
jgi:hypothetical protein